jgi:L-ribulokinase
MGSTGIIALDWFNGRRTPDANPHLAGAIFGLNLGSTAPMVYRALVESTACGARRIVERFISEGVAVNEIGAIGGIARKSPFIMQTCADIINKPIRISESDQACALGAAIFAAVAAGVYPDTEAAMSVMSAKYDIVYTPNPAQAKLGEELYQQYCRYADLVEKEVNSRLA